MAAEYPRVLVRPPAKKPECGRGFSPVAASHPYGKRLSKFSIESVQNAILR